MRLFKTIFFFLTLISFTAQAQMSGELILNNPDGKIDNAEATVSLEGAVEPVHYKWSLQHIGQDQNKATGITEGTDFSVLVTDATGAQLELAGNIPTESVVEGMNTQFVPIVNAIASVFFWDPLAFLGIRDPNIFQDKAYVKLNEDYGENKVTKWLVADGANVEEGTPIAEVQDEDGKMQTIIASDPGKLIQSLAQGETIKKGAIAEIIFKEKRPVLHPNGDQRSQGVPIIVLWLVLGAIFFSIRMKFINFRGVKHAVELVQGKFSNPDDKGEVSHFQALTTALSATVGLGNIAGVAVAIVVGGPGATFWMIVAGLLGMASKFVECTLGVKYRSINEDGEVSGGPMYYLSRGLEGKNMKGLGKVLAFIFAILCIGASFGGGNMFQANQAFDQIATQFPSVAAFGWVFGIILAVLVGIVIIGGIKSIAKVTDKIVPIMCGVYLLFSLIIILMNISNLGTVVAQIIGGAFSASALKGGFVGVLIIGFQRAAFSNEAGVGSASIAHSASKTNEHISEGTVALLEPFVDTVVVCTMTAMVLLFTGFADGATGLTGAALTSEAFSSVFPWFSWVLLIAILLFAFSTMVSWSYYGLKAWQYLFGESKTVGMVYKIVFLLFIVLGSSVGLGAVLGFSDLMILGMAFPNILGLVLLSKEVRTDMLDYFRRIKDGTLKRYK